MGKTSRRIWYTTAMCLSGFVLLLSLLGIAGVWVTEQILANSAVQILVAVENLTGGLRQVTQGVDQKLERMQAATISISTASTQLSQKVTDEGLVLLLLPEDQEQNLSELALSVKEAVSPLGDLLTAGVVIYRLIDQLPFIDLPAPSQEQVDRIEESAGEIQAAVDRLETDIAAFRSGTSDQITKVGAGADALTSRVGQARDQLANLDASLALAQESLTRLEQIVVKVLVLAALMFTLLLAWVIYSQIEVLRLYAQRWKSPTFQKPLDLMETIQ